MSEETTKIVIDTLKYYKNKKTARELEEVPVDILRAMYLDLLHNAEQLEKENEFWKEYKEKLDKLDTKDFIFKHELENYIPKSVIREKINKRQSELIQELKTFKDDIRLNTLQEIYYGEENE